jgi:enterobactin synthetase component D
LCTKFGVFTLEFLLGRCCAYEALFNLGNNADFLVRSKGGAPIWPDGFVGSISHTHGEILALATNQQHYLAVGIDIEKIICEQDAFSLINLVLNSDEKKLILGMDVQEMLIVITLIFSAKESFYKLIDKASEIVLDFNVISLLNFNKNNFIFRINKKINAKFVEGLILKGFYLIKSTSIITLLLESNSS